MRRQWTHARWLKVSPLLDQALDLAPEVRPAFLAAVRTGDAESALILEQLLVEHDRAAASGFLDSAPDVGGAPTSLAGQIVGPYTLERSLGVGGMGTVWLARRSDGRFEGSVAVKFVNLAVLDRVGQERFQREGTLLARLSHPNIARLFDAGVMPGGQPYLVLEYVEGMRLDRYADSHRLPIAARLQLFLQVADAVAHAHASLVVHRDLKPSNVLVDTRGQVKLLDFGIATLADAAAAERPGAVTASNALTPEYAAPEQIAGAPVTTAIDVYALGVLLYMLLVGQHPTAAMTDPPAVVLRTVAEREPVRLSDAAASLTDHSPDAVRILEARGTTRERLRRDCRGDLDTIVGKALKKSVAERYQTVTAFAEDVRRFLRREPVAARPDSLSYRTRKFVARHRLECAATMAIALALIAGTTIALRQARASAAERDRALEQLYRAETTNEFSSFLLAQARPGSAPISNKELLARGEALIDTRFAGDPVLRVHMLLMLAERYQENQQFVDWRRVLQRAYDTSRSLSDDGLRARAACAWGQQLAEGGDARQALSVIASAERGLPSTPEQADVASRCLVLESISAKMAGDASRAIGAGERAVAIEEAEASARRAAGGRMFEALAALASGYTADRRYNDADRTYRRAVDLLDRQGLGSTLDAAALLNNWSVLLQDSGRPLAAVAVSARAVQIARAADSEHGASLSMLSTYGNALAATGDHAAAVAAFDEAVTKARAAGSARRVILTLSYAIIDATEAADGDRAAALLVEAERANDPSPYSKGLVEASEARVALALHDADRAAILATRAVATLESATPNKASLQPTLTLLARVLNTQGRFDDALKAAERSLAMARQRLSDQKYSSAAGQALLQVALAKDGLGEVRGSAEAVAAAVEHLTATVGPKAPATIQAEALRARHSKTGH